MRLSAACRPLVVGLLLSAVMLLAVPRGARAQGMQPMCAGGCLPYQVQVTPDGDTSATQLQLTSGHTVAFTVTNTGTSSDEFDLACGHSGTVTSCSAASVVVLASGKGTKVNVTYAVGAAGWGSVTLMATSATHGNDDAGTWIVPAAGPPTVTLAAPGSGSAVTVHTRQPVIRAYFMPSTGDALDTALTVLTWRGDTITSLEGLRHNRGVLEWEVDSTHWLTAGLAGHAHADTAALVLKACGAVGGCTTVTRNVILSDATPILGFSGVPLGRVNGGYGAPFGPGLALSGADVTTGFSSRPYYSMGAARSVSLVYSTRQSYPRVLVPVDLDLPWPANTPSSMTVRLKDGAVVKDTLKLTSPNTSCLTGGVARCRVVLQADYGASSQTVVRKWLTVEATVVTDQARTSSDSVEVVIVDRRQSPYGSGWWPGAVSKLVQAGNDRILVGASGAAAIYRGNGDSVYLPPPATFTSITKNGATRELRVRGSAGVATYDSYGRLARTVDPSGNRDSLVYSGSSDQLLAVRDPVGQRDTLIYSGGLLARIRDPMGREDSVTINATTHQLTRRRLASPASRPDIITYAYQTYAGTYTNVLTRRMGTIGDTTRVVYDSTFRRRPVQVVLPRVQDETGSWVTPTVSYTAYERQGWGVLRSLDSVYVEMKDPLNHWTRSLLNRWAQPLKTWDALGLLGRSVYDPDGLVLWSEGKNGDSSRVYTAYDRDRRVVKSYIERGATSGSSVLRLDSLVYDANHRVAQRIDARGQSTYYTYDAQGRVTKVKTPNAAGFDSTLTWYHGNGLVDSTKTSGYSGRPTRYYYSSTGLLLRTLSNTSDTLSKNGYDDWGRPTSQESRTQVAVSGAGAQWQWTLSETSYGSDGAVEMQQTLLSQPSSDPLWDPVYDTPDSINTIAVTMVFDSAGRVVGRVNNRGKQTSYAYDRLGRVVARRPWADSVGVTDSMVYDLAGNLKKTISRRGVTITHYYDSRNRDTLTTIPGVGDVKQAYGGPQDQMTRRWLMNAVDSIGGVNGEVRSGYDSRGRLRADTAYTASTPRVTTYAYDTYERPSSTVNALGTWTVKYETVRGLADTLITPMADTILAAIDAKGQLVSRVIRSGGSRDSLSLYYKWNTGLQQMAHRVLPGSGYTAGQFDRQTADTSTLALSPTWTQTLGAGGATQVLQDSTIYDGWGRLTRWVGLKDNVAEASVDYSFDATGNLHEAGSTGTYDGTTDRLTVLVTGGVTHRYAYDRAGNLVTDSIPGGVVWHYGYDAVDRLVSARRNGVLIARYGYDVLGRRIVKRVYSTITGADSTYLRMVYSGSHVAFETDSAGTMGLKYTWGPGSDNLLAIEDEAGNHYYATTDRLGSVRSLAKRDGTWLLTRRWDPYGNEMTRDSSASFTWGNRLRYGWTGREYDTETGLYFHRARTYSPEQRRFIQEDPLAGSTSPYAYVQGSPLEATDPSGMVPSWGGTTGAGRQWARAHLDFWGCSDSAWNGPGCGRSDRDDEYNPFLPVNDGWRQAFYYDVYGRNVGRSPIRRSNDIYILKDEDGSYMLDGPLSYDGTPYEIHHDEQDYDDKTRELAGRAKESLGECNRACFLVESITGNQLDFKSPRYHDALPTKSLWNGGNGYYYHFDVVGNSAWALFGRQWEGYSLAELRFYAHLFTKVTTRRLDDWQDQWGIVHGYQLGGGD
jgi:RHS repeat-associated protein